MKRLNGREQRLVAGRGQMGKRSGVVWVRMWGWWGKGGVGETNAEVEAAGVAVVWGREEEGGAGMRAGGKGGTAAELIEEVVVAAEAGGWGGALRSTCGVGRPGLGVEMAEALLAASKEESRKEGRKWIGVDSVDA
ncbi:unnamed protein product [Closterium sp. NIES-65]|nr:unnamed protein product [Closterium sp. NIES-65]